MVKTANDNVEAVMWIDRGGDEFPVLIRGRVTATIDTNYGADADGGRGNAEVTIDDVSDLTAVSEDESEDIDLTEDEYERAVEKLSDAYLYG